MEAEEKNIESLDEKCIEHTDQNETEDFKSYSPKTKFPWLEIKILVGVVVLIVLISLFNSEDETPEKKLHSSSEFFSFGPDAIFSVYDGDTFRVNLKDLPQVFSEELAVRIAGIDAAEMAGTDGEVLEFAQKAQAFTQNALLTAEKIELKNVKRGKYFRIIADVFVDDKSLSHMLLEQGLVKEYDGMGTRPTW